MNWNAIILMATEAKKQETFSATQIKSMSDVLNKNHETLMRQATEIDRLKSSLRDAAGQITALTHEPIAAAPPPGHRDHPDTVTLEQLDEAVDAVFPDEADARDPQSLVAISECEELNEEIGG